MACMKLKALEQCLSELEGFSDPKAKLEQYETRAHIAARIMHTIQSSFGDLEGKMVADLGCGTGALSVGAALLGAQFVVGFDVDPDALTVLRQNVDELDLTNIEAILCHVPASFPEGFTKKFDTVVMNPPFGTSVKGIDMEFLKVALTLTNNCVYSLHKTSTRAHIIKKAAQFRVQAQVLAELRFDLPSTYRFHKRDSVDINVDFIRFTFSK